MYYDFIISRGTDLVQNNLAFMRKQLNLTSIQDEFLLLKECITDFLSNTNEIIEEQVRTILSKLLNQNIPLDNETSFRFINEYFGVLRMFDYDMYLIKRTDLVENTPVGEDGMALAYLLDLKSSPINNICEGIAREFEDYENPANANDAIMTWFITGEVTLNSDLENICFLENIKQDYISMRKRKSSIMFNSERELDMLLTLGLKPLLITNVLPEEYTKFDIEDLQDVN